MQTNLLKYALCVKIFIVTKKPMNKKIQGTNEVRFKKATDCDRYTLLSGLHVYGLTRTFLQVPGFFYEFLLKVHRVKEP